MTVLVDEALVARLADLANLELTSEEKARFSRDLGKILAYVDVLEEAPNVDTAPRATSVGHLRKDEPHASLPRDVALEQAPRAVDGGFAVPAFVDEG
jgi:aspartyl-tRNA(Asn)/glutamyl-tRNA(Gln) amidotransferase subunit C